jgi:molybdopterin-synthase adenylyltransferase
MDDEDLLRYSRHIMLPELDVAGQQTLLDASVLIVGLGGLGSPVAMYLAAAGIGHLLLADFDQVDLSNLQRQIIHADSRIGLPKVESAKAAIELLNHRTEVTCLNQKVPEILDDAWAENIHKANVVVDCTDNFGVRFALNRICVSQRKPLVSAAVTRLEAQLSVFDSRSPESPCYRCLYEPGDEHSLSCAESGVLSPLVGVVGSFQALEVIRLLVPFGRPLCGRLILFDAKYCRWRELQLERDPLCPVCGSAV